MSKGVIPFSLKDAPALIERLLPVQKLSAEVFKERKAGAGQTLVPLGAYWKGRKPLILNKACILGCLLPATDNPTRDLAIFEKLMAMDDESFTVRAKRRPKPKEILATLSISPISDYFTTKPTDVLPESSPVDWSIPEYSGVKVTWRNDLPQLEQRRLEVPMLPIIAYRERVNQSKRAEEVADTVHDHIWDAVNRHLGTSANSFPELVEQLGIMRFGHQPRVADTFSGSGQIPFSAGRLGCDTFASDLNPVACMLTWGANNIVGASPEERKQQEDEQLRVADEVLAEIDRLGVETDGNGWRVKAFLYCLEVRCPQTGWMVPLIPSMIVSHGKQAIVELIPVPSRKCYDIKVKSGVSSEELAAASTGSLRSDGRGRDSYLFHTVEGRDYRTKISTLRGDFHDKDGSSGNALRLWEKTDFKPRPDDIYQERLYTVHWMRRKKEKKTFDYEFRTVRNDDLQRECIVEEYVEKHFIEWQAKGWIPDMRIETGYNTDQPIRERGWTHWHHLFPPRHLMLLGLIRKKATNGTTLLRLAKSLDYTSKLCQWTTSKAGSSKPGGGGRTGGASDNPAHVFYNQALNTFYNYGCRAGFPLLQLFSSKIPLSTISGTPTVLCKAASEVTKEADIFLTDPPYGDAVKYEEILEFFIAWLRKNPPLEFSDWVWDSRRSLAIKGKDEDFRQGMVAAYKRMTESMVDNGIQVIMFTHQSTTLWADMANIVWAAGLQVTAAWYVVTETNSALRAGSYVKGTILLVLRKRQGNYKTSRDDLAWEIQEEVEKQIKDLTGLNQEAKGLYRDENVFEDADLQMAGYAAALRVLTSYTIIDGRNMVTEAIRPRIKGETTFVDGLIDFAVATANQCLVPQGIPKKHWDKLNSVERFYLKMLDLEARGAKTLDNYQNFAKAFKVHDFQPFMASSKANNARLKSAAEFGRTEMGKGSELFKTVLRAVLYAVMELDDEIDGNEVLAHLMLNIHNYYGDMTLREQAMDLADYLAKHLDELRPEEARAARVLRELLNNQRVG